MNTEPMTIDAKSITGVWHRTRNYVTSTKSVITVTGLITGCGLVQMKGVGYITDEEDFKKLLIKIITDYRIDGAGCIIATLGEDYYHNEKILLNSGFELLKEYQNYRHGDDYKQKLYCLTY